MQSSRYYIWQLTRIHFAIAIAITGTRELIHDQSNWVIISESLCQGMVNIEGDVGPVLGLVQELAHKSACYGLYYSCKNDTC